MPFDLRFLFASQPAEMGKVLGIVYRAIATHLIKKAGLTHATGQTGAVTLIQRFGSTLNLNIHFHMLFLDGVYVTGGDALCFRRDSGGTGWALRNISARVGRYLERQGLLVRTDECDAWQVANAEGFSLHAGVTTEAGTAEAGRACRYIARPAVSTERLSLTNQGHIRYALKTPYRDGTTHVIFEPLEPKPRVNLTRFHGVFAPIATCARRSHRVSG